MNGGIPFSVFGQVAGKRATLHVVRDPDLRESRDPTVQEKLPEPISPGPGTLHTELMGQQDGRHLFGIQTIAIIADDEIQAFAGFEFPQPFPFSSNGRQDFGSCGQQVQVEVALCIADAVGREFMHLQVGKLLAPQAGGLSIGGERNTMAQGPDVPLVRYGTGGMSKPPIEGGDQDMHRRSGVQ